MEQRAPGHTVLDDKIYRRGLRDFQADIDAAWPGSTTATDRDAYAKGEELKAMRIALDAVIRFAERHAEKARELAAVEADPARKAELERIAEVCARVPAHAPRDFWEALQAYWFVHLGVTTELNTWDAFCPGHLDRHLDPFYRHGLADGSLTRDQAEELLQCFWIKFNNQPAPPKVGVTAAESGTYTDFAQINVGGIMADGSDGVNDVTYLMLDVIEEMRLLQPSCSIQVSRKNPDRFIKRAGKIIRTGFGQPSVFNADLIVQELVRMGKTRGGCARRRLQRLRRGGRVRQGGLHPGRLLQHPEDAGAGAARRRRPADRPAARPADGRSGGVCATFEELFAAFLAQMRHFVEIKVRGNSVIERLYATYMPAPFLSTLIDDCIAKGRDYHDGGPRYDTTYIQGVGIGTITDALSAIKHHVFDRQDLTMAGLLAALDADFAGHERERQLLLNRTPRYGNDDDAADALMVRVFDAFFDLIDGRKNTRGGTYHLNMLPTTCHVYFGSVIGATPDGRRARTPLSEGISPVQGADRHGPTAVIKSAAKMDHARTGGTLLNQKFTPQLLADDDGLDKLTQLIRSYFRLDGHHIQFNVVDVETLRAARRPTPSSTAT